MPKKFAPSKLSAPRQEARTDLDLLSPDKREYTRISATIERADDHFLNDTLKTINRATRRQTSKSELIRLAILELRNKSIDEIKEALKEL